MTKIKIGLFGFGVVGQGIYEVVRKSKNAHAEIVKICVRDPKKPRKIEVDPSLFTTSVDDILDNQNINLVVEVIDDADAAYNIVKRAMLRGIPVVSGMLAAATVLVGLPELLASAAHRVAELEYACRFDCRAVALARLIVLGCSDVVTVTAIALAAPVMLGADPFASLVHACVPYFLSCAGALLVARRCPSSQALALSCAWALLVIVGTYAAFSLVPDAYAQASTWAWALVAAGSLGWAAHEVRTWIRGIEGGLDVFAPASAAR